MLAPAEAVVGLNEEWFRLLREHSPGQLRTQLTRLSKLGQVKGLSAALRDRPDFAGLFAEAADPVALSTALDGPDQDLLASLFALHVDRDEARDLAVAVIHDGPTIAGLARRGVFGAELLFFSSPVVLRGGLSLRGFGGPPVGFGRGQ